MIVIKIQGGLGNQLFQLALALALKSRLKNGTICIDKKFFQQKNSELTSREDIFTRFNIDEWKEAGMEDVVKTSISGRLRRLLFNSYRNVLINEKSKGFDPSILELKDSAYLNGYWQSFRYFEDIEFIIKAQFSLKTPVSNYFVDTRKAISSAPVSISLHVRRGDYISKYVNIYRQLSIDYYKKGIQFIKSRLKISNALIVIFSDDIDWCRTNIKLTDQTLFIENKRTNGDHEDMFLMAASDHNIIANSSFSWWAAWLNNNPDKIVVAPEQWYINQEPDLNNSLYPESWKRL